MYARLIRSEVLFLSLLVTILLFFGCGKPAPTPPAVVLVVLDTTRFDHLGKAGYPRDTSPNLDRLAEEGSWFSTAWAQAPWTLPAMATVLTGRLPSIHGAGMKAGRLYAVREEIPTLAQRLRPEGVQTGAVVNVVFCNPDSGIARGFEHYDFKSSDASNRNHRNASETTDASLAWLESVRDRPFFLLVHYFDAHLTYDPPAPFDTRFLPPGSGGIRPGFGSASEVIALRNGKIRLSPERREALIARYDGEIAYLDREFGRLRKALEQAGRWENSLVIVVADHGEEFWDHGGFEHGHTHFQELLHIPLIVRRPGGTQGEVRGERVRQLDIAPTILDFFGVAPAPELPGSVLGSGRSGPSRAEGSLWSGEMVSIRNEEGTLIRYRASGRSLLFASDDLKETSDLSRKNPALLRKMEAALAASDPGIRREGESREPDQEELERLRSLGYVQ